MEPTVDIIIPCYKPEKKFTELLKRIHRQTIVPNHIFIVNTEKDYWDKKWEYDTNLSVTHIKKEEFDHGGTRAFAASFSHADILMFMTQDAIPKDDSLIENLIKPFRQEKVAASYARQIVGKKAGEIERFTRNFNYPEESFLKSKEDEERLGIKTWFCSNVCAAYKRAAYQEVGGFVKHTIFNEDMILCAKLIDAGYQVFYAADAQVIHSHSYSPWQQFSRNFDLGVSHRQYQEIFSRVSSKAEGIKLVKQTAQHLKKVGKNYLLPELFLESGAKFLGYQLGKHYDWLPPAFVKKFTMNQGYFEKQEDNL